MIITSEERGRGRSWTADDRPSASKDNLTLPVALTSDSFLTFCHVAALERETIMNDSDSDSACQPNIIGVKQRTSALYINLPPSLFNSNNGPATCCRSTEQSSYQ